tara:strand:+ start:690 stop:872 length:183 start_codon:yes stop_codon:yes gene_type:complete
MPKHYPTPPPAPAPKAKRPKRDIGFDDQDTNNAAGKPVSGTGSRYNKDGTKKNLGIGWGP